MNKEKVVIVPRSMAVPWLDSYVFTQDDKEYFETQSGMEWEIFLKKIRNLKAYPDDFVYVYLSNGKTIEVGSPFTDPGIYQELHDKVYPPPKG